MSIRLLWDLLFGATLAVWFGLAVLFGWRYLTPRHRGERRPQQVILVCACIGWPAFVLHVRGWLPHPAIDVFEVLSILGAVLALVGVYMYEVEGGGRRR